MHSIIVIGAGQAGLSAAARVRDQGFEGRVLLFGDENERPYQRPPLSKKYATGEMNRDQLLLRPTDWFEDNRVEWLNLPVASVDTNGQTLKGANGETFQWDRLIFATGARARSLPASMGGSLENVLTLRTLENADRLGALLVPGKRIVIIGGGYIGLEAAAVCASKGLGVTLLEAAPRILQRVACQETSNAFRNLHQSQGVRILEDALLKRLHSTNGQYVSGVELETGETIPCDFVLVGIGIEPSTQVAEAAGIECNGGIIVNAHCCSSAKHVFAAGDCALLPFQGLPTRLESVQNAIDQAECAADNALGQQRVYEPVPWFWSDQYDVKLQIAGLNRGYTHVVTRPGIREGSQSHWYFSGDTFLAVDALNDPRSYMTAKKLLETGRSVNTAQAGDPDFDLKSLL